ncbi:NAD(P)/FAD-dependent oxidoreductase [Phenylobacterium sp. VNQ135]|uniref:NAD(P)/FAD-dependent oxidoreductase n=1 Tax=Phenylobacterium sp. VNQ135 TaxID=3400922 RepID=UPI003C0044F7
MELDVVVVGAGAVGLAAARALSLAGRQVMVLEAAQAIGSGISSRNSEVIHAGIYYPQGSLKARLCVAGRRALYAFCERHGVAHRRCGKLIVATEPDQVAALDGVAARARANGVEGLQLLDEREAQRLEPALRAQAALLSTATGIFDTHADMLALLGDAASRGAELALGVNVTGLVREPNGWGLLIEGESQPVACARMVVNAAGLGAQALASRTEGLPAEHRPPLYYAKGSYFVLQGRSPFGHLIYPLPEPGGLGVHLTLDLGGGARFGPDVEWVDVPTYDVDPRRAQRFYGAVRAYWPALPDAGLQPGYAGVRPKLSGSGADRDFEISGPADHGMPGLVNLFGVESPGLTASLAIGEHVADLLSA